MIAGFDIKTIDDELIANKKVLVRVDFNVSLSPEGAITDDTRITQAIPTIKKLLENKNKLILVSHLGRPKGFDPKYSLQPVRDCLQKIFADYSVMLVTDFQSYEGKKQIENQKENEIILLENIRFFKGEKKNDEQFAKQLATLADIYVDDAFGSVHRAHASVAGVPQFIPGFAGLLLKEEIEMLSKIVNNPDHPVVAILAGAKISTKIGLISALMKTSDYIIVGGGIANTFLKAKGYKVGVSLVEEESIETASQMLTQFENSSCKLILPVDAICGNLQDSSIAIETNDVSSIPHNMSMLDIGPQSEKLFDEIIKKGKTIVWNGPVGMFENPLYRHGTDAVYNSVVSQSGATTIAGGGDTLAAIADKTENDKITHISTGGGAMLEFIEKGTLPGIEALSMKHES